jgi:hypothetical protein
LEKGIRVRKLVKIDQKSSWLREVNGIIAQETRDVLATGEQYRTVKEVATLLNLSQDAVRRMFHDEPGVLVLGDRSSKHTRRYTTLRIPDSVLRRVLRRNSNV